MFTLLKFEADWCAPCKQMKPLVDRVAENYSGKLKVKPIDVDLPKNRDLVMDHGVRAIPTLVLIEGKEGNEGSRVLGTLRGSVPQSELTRFIETHLEVTSV